MDVGLGLVLEGLELLNVAIEFTGVLADELIALAFLWVSVVAHSGWKD